MKKIWLITPSILLLTPTILANVSCSNSSYKEKTQEMRAVWLTPLKDPDFYNFTTPEAFKTKIDSVMQVMNRLHLNTLIYHVRTHNDAMYKSEANPVSPYFEKVDFEAFDPVEYVIEQAHKHGIEFHAWFNPYRIVDAKVKTTKEEIAARYSGFPLNPASKVENILSGKVSFILDPGSPEVQTFITDTIAEFVVKYPDIDGVHFDDYFYDDLGANGNLDPAKGMTILQEQDQPTYEKYINDNPGCHYKKDSAQDKADWRRFQVNNLIRFIHNRLDDFNTTYNKYIQWGISPTCTWKNGDGKVTYNDFGDAISSGSKTSVGQHYDDYHFSDTLYWVNNQWIDYIMPQCYGAEEYRPEWNSALISWWSQVVKHKKVNCFIGVGLYRYNRESESGIGWNNNPDEMKNQVRLINDTVGCDGASVFFYGNLLDYINNKTDSMAYKQVKNMVDSGEWANNVPCPEIKSFDTKIKLPAVTNIQTAIVEDKTNVTYSAVTGSKFYVIYVDDKPYTMTNGLSYTLPIKTTNIKVKALSYTNTIGE